MYVTSISFTFYGQMFICLKIITVEQNNEKEEERKSKPKEK